LHALGHKQLLKFKAVLADEKEGYFLLLVSDGRLPPRASGKKEDLTLLCGV
jgi:hypothetical protein